MFVYCQRKLKKRRYNKQIIWDEVPTMVDIAIFWFPVPWYMFNGLEHTAILSNFFTFITGSSSRLLRIRISAAVTLFWFPVRHFRCKEFNPLVIWIWNQNIATSTIVGTSFHNTGLLLQKFGCAVIWNYFRLWMLKNDSKSQCVLAH
jgi:hypothetical protein